MSLAYKLETLEGVEEAVQGLYKEVDGGYQLDVSGVAAKEKVTEFRESNIELTNKMTALEKKMAGLDIDKLNTVFQTVQNMAQSEEDVEMTAALEQGAEAVNALVEKRASHRAEAMKTDFETKMAASTDATNKYRTQLTDAKITAELTRLAAEKGVRTTAVDDVLLRGKTVFTLGDDGEVVAMKDKEVIYNKDNQPLTIAEYMDELATSAPHLFEVSTGGGANNENKTPTKTGPGFEYRGKTVKYSK